jgi:hypothetical protein
LYHGVFAIHFRVVAGVVRSLPQADTVDLIGLDGARVDWPLTNLPEQGESITALSHGVFAIHFRVVAGVVRSLPQADTADLIGLDGARVDWPLANIPGRQAGACPTDRPTELTTSLPRGIRYDWHFNFPVAVTPRFW